MKLPMKFRYYIKHPLHLWYDLTNPLKWAWQRVFRGWDDRVIWSLDGYLANFLPVWLEALKQDTGIPVSFIPDDYDESGRMFSEILAKWHGELDIMIEGFQAASRASNLDYDFKTDYRAKREEDIQKAELGLEKFKEYFFDLWC